MTHFVERLFGTKHQSFVIGKTLTPTGIVFGPTLFQGTYPPNPITDSISNAINTGDIWIQTGPSPSINQFISNTWTQVVSDPASLFNSINTIVSNAISDLATTQYVDNSIVNYDTFNRSLIANSIIDLATYSYVNNSISLLANTISNNSNFANTVTTDIKNALSAQGDPTLLNVSTVTYTGIPTGSPQAPYNTIQAALMAANSVNATSHVVIHVAPGIYNENVVMTRPLTHIVGINGYARAVQIMGNLIIQPSNVSVSGGPNSIFGLSDLSLTGNAFGPIVHATGSNTFNFIGNRLFLFSTSGSGFLDDVSVSHRVELSDTQVEVQTGNATAFSISNANFFVHKLTLNSGTGLCYAQSGGYTIGDTSYLTVNASNTTSAIAHISGGGVFGMGTTIFQNNGANGTGVIIDAGSTAEIVYSSFDVQAGSGFAVQGSPGSVFLYNNLSFVPGTNNKVSAAMGAGVIQLANAITLA